MIGTILLIVVFSVFFIAGVIGIVIGIALARQGGKNRGWESPVSLIARDTMSLIGTSLIYLGWRDDVFGEFPALVLLAILGSIGGFYIIWNDRKHAINNGVEWRFL